MELSSRLRLRPSVAMVPMGGVEWQFFLGNTRRSFYYKLRPELAAAVRQLGGELTLGEVACRAGAHPDQLAALADVLHYSCIVEDVDVAKRVAVLPWRRLINFFGDYVPSYGLEEAFARLAQTRVVVLGVGAVGSWVSTQLCQSAIGSLLLVDDDIVEESNLNRSLYTQHDLGKHKVDALAQRLCCVRPDLSVETIRTKIKDATDLACLLRASAPVSVVVNCADFPSVDATSALVDAACKDTRTPYVIAGGYNLHLSLVGMTVIPG